MLGLEIYHMKEVGGKMLCFEKATVENPISEGVIHINPHQGCFVLLKFKELPDKD